MIAKIYTDEMEQPGNLKNDVAITSGINFCLRRASYLNSLIGVDYVDHKMLFKALIEQYPSLIEIKD